MSVPDLADATRDRQRAIPQPSTTQPTARSSAEGGRPVMPPRPRAVSAIPPPIAAATLADTGISVEREEIDERSDTQLILGDEGDGLGPDEPRAIRRRIPGGREQDHRRVDPLEDPAADVEAVEVGQPDVEQDEVG